MRLAVHVLLFLVVSLAICLLSALFAEPEDGPALRGLPRRVAVFALGCALLAAVLLALEHTFASIH